MKLCTPANIFLVTSLFFFIILSYKDYYHVNASCMASYQCTPSKPLFFYMFILLLIGFWTWILNLQCNMGLSALAWAEVILPVILMYIGFQFSWNPYFFYENI